MLNWIKGWKTMGFGTLLVLLGQLQQSDIWALLPPQYAGLAVSVIGVLVMILRLATNTPLGESEPVLSPEQIVAGVQKVLTEAGVVKSGIAAAEGGRETGR